MSEDNKYIAPEMLVQRLANWWWSASEQDKFVACYGREPIQFEDGAYEIYYLEKVEIIRKGFFAVWGVLDLGHRADLLRKIL